MQILFSTSRRPALLEGTTQELRALITSISQCAKDLRATATVCSADFTLMKRNEVLYELKGQSTPDAKQKLREAPFDRQAWIEDEAFERAFNEARKIKRDDVLFNPVSFHATLDKHFGRGYEGSSTRDRGPHSRGMPRGKRDYYRSCPRTP